MYAVAGGMFSFSGLSFGLARRFLAEVRNEMGRVTWPSQKEVYATTVVVILFSVTMGLYLWGVDMILAKALGWVYRMFGAV